jgi:hypothetical protein
VYYRRIKLQAGLGKMQDPNLQNNQSMVQVVEDLPIECKALSLNPITAPKKIKNENKSVIKDSFHKD